MYINNPLIIAYPISVSDNFDVKKSIDSFLNLLIRSDKHSCLADNEFGFDFEDFRYEIFSLERGRFIEFNTSNNAKNAGAASSITDPLYTRKIIGNDKNDNTFAKELKKTICLYEKRLKDVAVSMKYLENSNGKVMNVTVNGKINDDTQRPYSYDFKIIIW